MSEEDHAEREHLRKAEVQEFDTCNRFIGQRKLVRIEKVGRTSADAVIVGDAGDEPEPATADEDGAAQCVRNRTRRHRRQRTRRR